MTIMIRAPYGLAQAVSDLDAKRVIISRELWAANSNDMLQMIRIT